jgi:hypothetical protein
MIWTSRVLLQEDICARGFYVICFFKRVCKQSTVFGVSLRKLFCSSCQWIVLLKAHTDSAIRVSMHWVRNVSDLCVPGKSVDLTYQTCSHTGQDTADKTGVYCCRQFRREFRLNVKHSFIFLNVYFRSDLGGGVGGGGRRRPLWQETEIITPWGASLFLRFISCVRCY